MELRPLIGNRVYGCDDCQLACPWNRYARVSGEPDFRVRHGLDDVLLTELFAWTESAFRERTAGSAIRRIGFERWSRNLAVGLGNAPSSAGRRRRAEIARRGSIAAGTRARRLGPRAPRRLIDLRGLNVRLHQLKLDFVPEQDRLLLRVSTDSRLEVRLWLTRRALRLLWPLLLQMLRAAPEIALQSNPQARDALVGLQHEQALVRANFAEAFEDAPRDMPLGAEPILVVHIRADTDENNNPVLGLLPQQGQGIHLTLDNHAAALLVQAAAQRRGQSDWDIAAGTAGVAIDSRRNRAPKSVN